MKNVTIFIPLSRPDKLDFMLQQVSKLSTPNLSISLLIVSDNKDIDANKIRLNCARYEISPIVHETGRYAASEFHMPVRRERIAHVFSAAQQHIPKDTDFVFTIEDDSLIKPDTLMVLRNDYVTLSRDHKVGLVSGVQVGRWGFKMIGAWNTNDLYHPTQVITIPYTVKQNITEVDAAGFYCFLTTRELFISVKHSPFFGPCGPDVNFGIELKKKEYRNYVDRSVVTGHIVSNGVLYPDDECVVVEFKKIDDKWIRTRPFLKNV